MANNAVYNEQIKQAMNKWGVSWFKFDESSGNVTDSKGTAVGTVTGATRVSGWNGQGYAMNFNGSGQYVIMNNPVFPMGNKTIRFKLKINSYPTGSNASVIACTRTNYDKNGVNIELRSNVIEFVITTAGSSWNTIGKVAIIPITKDEFNIGDGQWHDILFYYDSVSKESAGYIDGVFIKSAISTVTELPQSSNLNLGRWSGGDYSFFAGQIDDFQVYNMALIPSDFILNKTLILWKNEYNTYNSGWQTVSSTPPSESQYLSDGIDDLSVLERKVQSLPSIKMNKSEILLQNGKLFTKSIDLKKYTDIRSINVEVE